MMLGMAVSMFMWALYRGDQNGMEWSAKPLDSSLMSIRSLAILEVKPSLVCISAVIKAGSFGYLFWRADLWSSRMQSKDSLRRSKFSARGPKNQEPILACSFSWSTLSMIVDNTKGRYVGRFDVNDAVEVGMASALI